MEQGLAGAAVEVELCVYVVRLVVLFVYVRRVIVFEFGLCDASCRRPFKESTLLKRSSKNTSNQMGSIKSLTLSNARDLFNNLGMHVCSRSYLMGASSLVTI